MAIFDHYLEDAQAIQRKFRTERARVEADKELTPEGKRRRVAELDTRRQQEVAELQTRIGDSLNNRRTTLQATVQREREQQVEARRKVLGDQLLGDLYRHELEASDPATIVQAYQEASSAWEREVIGGYGRAILAKLQKSEDFQTQASAVVALNELKTNMAQFEPEGYRKASTELQDIEEAIKRLPELDREAYNAHIADRMGVDARYMDMAEMEAA